MNITANARCRASVPNRTRFAGLRFGDLAALFVLQHLRCDYPLRSKREREYSIPSRAHPMQNSPLCWASIWGSCSFCLSRAEGADDSPQRFFN